MIKPGILENQVRSVYLAIGSNLGNKKFNINKAKFKLHQKNIKILQSSNYYETLSWPNPKNPKFLNIILKVNTNLKPDILLKKCKEIELKLGRKKSEKNSPRICDIDIIDYDKETNNNGVILPHPRMHLRSFVLLPLFEINKNWRHPVTRLHIKKLILMLSDKDITTIKLS